MEDRRKINRVSYPTKSVLVDCETQTRYYVKTDNVSPLGMGLIADSTIPNLVGKDVIIVAETMIMYADVIRQVKNDDGYPLYKDEDGTTYYKKNNNYYLEDGDDDSAQDVTGKTLNT